MQEQVIQTTAQALVDAGVRVESASDWTMYGGDWQVLPHRDFVKMPKFPAPTDLELLKVLPETVKSGLETFNLVIKKNSIGYENENRKGDYIWIIENHQPIEAIAQLVIWCKENGYMEEQNES